MYKCLIGIWKCKSGNQERNLGEGLGGRQETALLRSWCPPPACDGMAGYVESHTSVTGFGH